MATMNMNLVLSIAIIPLTWLSIVESAPALSTDIFVSQCGYIESPIVIPAPPPPYPPPRPPSSPPPPSPPVSSPPPPDCGLTVNEACGAVIPSFAYKPGVNFAGGFIKSNYVGSAATTCAWACLDLPGCVVFSQNKSDGTCSFKNASAVATSTSGFDSWQLCGGPSFSPSATKKTVTTEGREFRRRLLQVTRQGPAPLLWSNSSTWPDGVVPGVGKAIGANATIPCNTVVILNVPNVTLGLLRVQGLLQFLDDPTLPLIQVKANFILVEGQLFIGSASQPFRQKTIIELTPNTAGNRAPLQYTFALPADPANPRNMGHKAFVVVGGQVRMYGLPGPSNMPVWVRLGADAYDDDTTITVDADLAGRWPVGGQIVVTSSDYDRFQAESFKIVNITKTSAGQSIIALDKPLNYRHFGTVGGAVDGYGNSVEERAEVILLSRNIVITGTDEPAPYHLEGGHFMVFQTPYPPQYIEGVEFFKMGQQGVLGRYSMHFHILGAVPGTVCRKNAIHQSKQRCIVNHASHNITFDSNVAYNTSGHCFMLEEGGEENNTWINNIGVLTNAVSVRISTDETDDRSSTFWITNLRNTYIGNVAAGSQEAGFWFELRGSVRGNSLTIPSINKTVPIDGTLTLFVNNSAHSNGGVGLRTYPNGMRPRVAWNTYGKTNVLDGIRSYKNVWLGMFVHNTDSLHITNSVFADNGWGLQFNRNNRINVTNTKFIALTSNYGNPSSCWDGNSWSNCRPLSTSSCKMPLKWGVPGRSTGGRGRLSPNFGLLVDQNGFWDYWPYTFKNLSFTNYDATCSMMSGLLLLGTGENWNAGYNVEGLSFSNNSQAIWSSPRIAQINPWSLSDGGEQSQFYTVFDRDGSLTGSKGYLVANNTAILPPDQGGCVAKPSWNAYSCSNVCYRTVLVTFPEPGFYANPKNADNTREMFSYLRVTRLSDNQQLLLDGNLKDTNPSFGMRNFFFNVLANQTYAVEVVGPAANPSFVPSNITSSLRDVGDCGLGLTLRFRHSKANPWSLDSSNTVFPTLCSGVTAFSPQYPTAQYSQVCSSGSDWVEVVLSPGLGTLPISPSINPNYVVLVKGKTPLDGNCTVNIACSLLWSGTNWLYDDSGLERRPSFYNPVLSKPANWKNGPAPLGYAWWTSYLATSLSGPNSTNLVSYYYRKNFNLSNINCYTSITIDVLVHDGVIVYINNVEAVRANMLPGFVNYMTNANTSMPWLTWKSYTIVLSDASTNFSLVEGTNVVAVEQHMARWSGAFAYDMRIQATRSNAACNSTQVSKPEVCDGVDNDLDGLVDRYPNGSLLAVPCSTSCGVGVMTCVDGFYQGCTAKALSTEVCDGLDNNCDGLIDNGVNQLNCTAGNVCFQGACVPLLNATSPVQVWSRNATDWSFNDKGKNLDALLPDWRSGASSSPCSCSSNGTGTNWQRGPAPLGYDYRDPPMPWQWIGTELSFFPANGKSMTGYFAKSFSLTAEQLNSTFNIDFSVRRVDGVVVYLNGVELWRDNMNWGTVLHSNTSNTYVADWQEKLYYPCRNCRRNNSALLRAGANYIVAELHIAANWRRFATFDLDLYRNTIVPCPASTPACARQVEQQIIESGSVWKYLDGSSPPPSPESWMTLGFNDTTWATGAAPLGYGSGNIRTWVNNGSISGSETTRTLYFRRWQNISEAACYFGLNFNLLGKDGAVVYVNGVEAYRTAIPEGPTNSTVYAWGNNWNWVTNTNITGGWLKTGLNLFAIEVHRNSYSLSNVYFDLSLTGRREAVTCSPDPSPVSILWGNN